MDNVDPKTQQALQETSSEAAQIVQYLRTVQITTAEAYAAGAEQLVEVKRRVKALEQEKRHLLEPLKLAQKRITELVDKPLRLFQEAESVMKAALMAFDTRREAEELAAMQRAAELGRAGAGNQALATLQQVQSTPEVAGVSFRETLDFAVTDLVKVPLAYMQVNRTAVLAALRAGTEIPGIEVVKNRTMAVRT